MDNQCRTVVAIGKKSKGKLVAKFQATDQTAKVMADLVDGYIKDADGFMDELNLAFWTRKYQSLMAKLKTIQPEIKSVSFVGPRMVVKMGNNDEEFEPQEFRGMTKKVMEELEEANNELAYYKAWIAEKMPHEIFVNTTTCPKKITIHGSVVTYAEVIKLAGKKYSKDYIVKYRKGNKTGSLLPDQSVSVKDGMQFDVK